MELVASAEQISIPRGIQFSPDGSCVLTSIKDELHLYNTYDHLTINSNSNSNSNDVDDVDEVIVTNSSSDNTTTTAPSPSPPTWKPALIVKGGDVGQSYDWYPLMNSQQPTTCCFVATQREQPVHLYDAYTGTIRATYATYHPDRDEPDSPLITKFHPLGGTLLCAGFRRDRYITLFDVSRPGRDPIMSYRLGKTRRSQDGQKGIVSALGCSADAPNVLAVGTYSPGSIYLYDTRVADNAVATILHGGVAIVGHGKNIKRRTTTFVSQTPQDNHNDDHDDDVNMMMFSKAKALWFQKRAQTGVTQLEFCQNLLLSASRRSDAILCWDVRMITSGGDDAHSISPLGGIKSYPTNHATNQRMGFHVDQSMSKIHVGDVDRTIKVYDVLSGDLEETINMPDVVNDVSMHSKYVSVSLGQRTFVDEQMITNGSIQLWRRPDKS